MDAATVWLIVGIAGFILAAVFLIISIVLFVKQKIPMVIGDLSGKTRARAIEQLRAENEKSGPKGHRPSTLNMNRGPLTTPVSETKTTSDPERPAFVVAHPSKRLDTGEMDLVKSTDVLTPGTSVLPQSQETEVLQPGTTVLDNPDGSKPTAVLETQSVEATAVLDQGEKTTVLADSGATAALDQREKTTVLADSGATEVLDAMSEPTVSLPSAKKPDLLFAGVAVSTPSPQRIATEPTTVLDDAVAASVTTQKAIRFEIIKDIKIIHADEIIM